jgi:hypothetical protein
MDRICPATPRALNHLLLHQNPLPWNPVFS